MYPACLCSTVTAGLRYILRRNCLLLDGVYRLTDGVPIFQPVSAPTTEQLQALLTRIITRLLKMFTRHGALMEEVSEIPYLTNPIPEPSTMILCGTGKAGVMAWRMKKVQV